MVDLDKVRHHYEDAPEGPSVEKVEQAAKSDD